MIEDIRNWFGDLASGKIKDAQIALSEAQIASFQRQLEAMDRENKELRSRVAELERQLAHAITERDEFKSQLAAQTSTTAWLDPECEKILFLLFDTDQKLTIDQVQGHFRLQPSVAKHYFDILRDNEFVYAPLKIRPAFQRPEPVRYNITSEGREYVMRRRKAGA